MSKKRQKKRQEETQSAKIDLSKSRIAGDVHIHQEQIISNEKPNDKKERRTKIAQFIGVATVIVAILVFLFGDGVLNKQQSDNSTLLMIDSIKNRKDSTPPPDTSPSSELNNIIIPPSICDTIDETIIPNSYFIISNENELNNATIITDHLSLKLRNIVEQRELAENVVNLKIKRDTIKHDYSPRKTELYVSLSITNNHGISIPFVPFESKIINYDSYSTQYATACEDIKKQMDSIFNERERQ